MPGDPKTQLDTFLRALEDARRVAREANARVERMEHALRLLESAAGEVLGGLPSSQGERIIRSMDVNTQNVASRRGAGRATRKHPAQRRLYERGQTITGLATELGEGRPRVSAWFATGDGNRPIPRRHAEALKATYGIPLSSWSRIAD